MKKTKKVIVRKQVNFGRIKKVIYFSVMILVIVFGLWGFFRAYAWTDNASTPPTNNVNAPINTGSNPQAKAGTFAIGNFMGSIGGLQFTTGGTSPISNRIMFGTDGTGWKLAISKNQAGTVTDLMTISDADNVGIGDTNPTAKLTLPNATSSAATDGITWYSPSPLAYGIYKTAGSWTGPNYQQLTISWNTGIIIDGGTLYGKSGIALQPNGGNVTINGKGVCLADGTNCLWGNGTGVHGNQLFTSNGTFTVPAGINIVFVTIAGGGGGGGGGDHAGGFVNGGGGGGAGNYIIKSPRVVTPSTPISVVVGLGGAGAAQGNTNGSAGGNSSFGSIVAVGGGGGAMGYTPGSGGGGTSSCSGGSGGSGNYNATLGAGGNGGYCALITNGATGMGGAANGTRGTNATDYGSGGGGGGYSSGASYYAGGGGGNGVSGFVLVEW